MKFIVDYTDEQLKTKASAEKVKQLLEAPIDMHHGDFGMYMADIFAGNVQYGSTTEFCNWITSLDQ